MNVKWTLLLFSFHTVTYAIIRWWFLICTGLSSSTITSTEGNRWKTKKYIWEFTRRKITWWKVDWWCNIVIFTRLSIFRWIMKILNLIDVREILRMWKWIWRIYLELSVSSLVTCLLTHFAFFSVSLFHRIKIIYDYYDQIKFSKIGYAVLHLVRMFVHVLSTSNYKFRISSRYHRIF